MENGSGNMATVQINGKDLQESVRSLLRTMLESGLVGAVLVPRPTPGGSGYVHTLVTTVDQLADSAPLAPTVAVHGSQILSDITPNTGERIAAVLRPCELRGAVELVKFLQVDLDKVITVGVDCSGTYDVAEYAGLTPEQRESIGSGMVASFDVGNGGSNGISVRETCRICRYPAPLGADISVSLYGHASEGQIALALGDRYADEIREKLQLNWTDGRNISSSARQEQLSKVHAERESARETSLSDLKSRVSTPDGLIAELSTCIRCHNCMNVCPICYCKECVFVSSVFDNKADSLFAYARAKGAIRLPSDTLIFHMTRMSHMGTSCVSCGMCESACPSDIPVSRLFSLIGGELQDMFEYKPGLDIADEPPVKVFKETELEAESGSAQHRH